MINSKTPTKSEIKNLNSKIPPEIRTFASGQYTCEMAYYLSNQKPLPKVVKILNDDGAFYSYCVKPMELKPGLVAYILVPKNQEKHQDVKVIFRGTDFSDIDCALMNLEHGGPAVESFEEEKEKIFSSLKEALSEFPASTLTVYGHSKGASIAQLFITELLERQYMNESFSGINTVKMTVLNSPGVPPNVAKKAEYYSEKLKQINPSLKIVANYGMVGGDPVQVTGLDMIFANSSSDIVELNLLKLDRGLEGAWKRDFFFDDGIQYDELIQMLRNFISSFKAHQNVHFFAPKITDETGRIGVDLPENQRSYYSNKTPEGALNIRAELLHKILIPSYAFYLFAETARMVDVGYLSSFIPSSVSKVGKSILNWFTPRKRNNYDINENKILVSNEPLLKSKKLGHG